MENNSHLEKRTNSRLEHGQILKKEQNRAEEAKNMHLGIQKNFNIIQLIWKNI